MTFFLNVCWVWVSFCVEFPCCWFFSVIFFSISAPNLIFQTEANAPKLGERDSVFLNICLKYLEHQRGEGAYPFARVPEIFWNLFAAFWLQAQLAVSD